MPLRAMSADSLARSVLAPMYEDRTPRVSAGAQTCVTVAAGLTLSAAILGSTVLPAAGAPGQSPPRPLATASQDVTASAPSAGDPSGYADPGYGEESGYGEQPGGYGDTETPPTSPPGSTPPSVSTPPAAPPSSPPPTTSPPVATTPPPSSRTSTPPPSSPPPTSPPVSTSPPAPSPPRPTRPPHLAETGDDNGALVLGGIAAGLVAAGAGAVALSRSRQH